MRKLIAALFFAVFFPCAAFAQSSTATPDGSRVPNEQWGYLGTDNLWHPCTLALCVGSGGGGGGGGAVTGASNSFADGWNQTEGTTGVSAWGLSGAGTEIAIEKEIAIELSNPQAVTGTFYQSTQPVSAASLPLPSGAATSANQPALNGDGGAAAHVTNFPSNQTVTPGAQSTAGTANSNFDQTGGQNASQVPIPALLGTKAYRVAANNVTTTVLMAAQTGLRWYITSLYCSLRATSTLGTAGTENFGIDDGATILYNANSYINTTAANTPAPAVLFSVSGLQLISSAANQALNVTMSTAGANVYVDCTVTGGYTAVTP